MPPRLHTDPIPVIGYIRVSLAREEMISPDIQRSAQTAWAARTGRTIIGWVIDLDQTGRNFRRKVMGAIERIEAGEAREIGVYRYDRWGRNAAESLANVYRLEMAGGQLQSATEELDVETAIGRFSRTTAFAVAEMQSDIIGDNWKAALANRVERGLTTSGTPRFAYLRRGRIPDPLFDVDFNRYQRYRRDLADPDGERYVPDYASGLADAHVEMYDQFLRGNGFGKIGGWLNEHGILNTRGAKWSDTTVKNVLDSGFAAGLLRLHNPQCRCGKPSNCGDRVYVDGAQEPILDADTWQEYRDTRQRRLFIPPRRKASPYPLSGHVYCGHCDSTMKIQNGGYPSRAGYSYRCRRWHSYRDCDGPFPRRALLEEATLERLAAWSADIESRAAVEQARARASVTAESDEQRLSKRVADADAALQRLMVQKAKEGDRMPDSVYEASRDELLTERDEAQAALDAVRERVAVLAPTKDVGPLMVELVTDWDSIPGVRRREMLGHLVRHIKAWRDPADPSKEVRVEITPVWEPCDCCVCTRVAERANA